MDALLKVAGRIKLILSANFDACFINLWHNDACLPKGGFPITWMLPFILDGSQLKKSIFFMLAFFGAISRKIFLHLIGFKGFKKLPFPADGSIIKSLS
jgi:hypothetical protein